MINFIFEDFDVAIQTDDEYEVINEAKKHGIELSSLPGSFHEVGYHSIYIGSERIRFTLEYYEGRYVEATLTKDLKYSCRGFFKDRISPIESAWRKDLFSMVNSVFSLGLV